MKEDFASFEIIIYAKILFCKYSDTNDKYLPRAKNDYSDKIIYDQIDNNNNIP